MAIIFFGTPAFAIPPLKALLDSGEEITFVVTRLDAPKGRGKIPAPPPIKEFALKDKLKVLQPASMKDAGFIRELKRAEPEFLVVVAYGKILPKEILSIPSIAPVNVHASLLPKYRGASPIAWAIINGERETGISTMLMSPGLDEGDILLQEKTEIKEEDTKESLSERLSLIGAQLLLKTLKSLRQGTLKPHPQTGIPSFAPPLKKEDGLIDWKKSARELFDFVRGMYPWPGAFSFLSGERLKIIKARVVDGAGTPGVVEKVEKNSLAVGTGKGLLSILELQAEGKRQMETGVYLQGHKIEKGYAFKNSPDKK